MLAHIRGLDVAVHDAVGLFRVEVLQRPRHPEHHRRAALLPLELELLRLAEEVAEGALGRELEHEAHEWLVAAANECDLRWVDSVRLVWGELVSSAVGTHRCWDDALRASGVSSGSGSG